MCEECTKKCPFNGLCDEQDAVDNYDAKMWISEQAARSKLQQEEDHGIVSPEKPKIVIPKFSVNSAIFVVYTSFNRDKSRTNIRAVSFPKVEVLLKDLGLLIDDIIARYSKEFIIVPRMLLPGCSDVSDDSDVVLMHFSPGLDSEASPIDGYISICVIPNSQNLYEMGTKGVKSGNLAIMPLWKYSTDLYSQVQEFISDDFSFKYKAHIAKTLPTAKDVRGKVSDKDAQQAWLTLLAYYDSYPEVTKQMAEVMWTVRKELSKKG